MVQTIVRTTNTRTHRCEATQTMPGRLGDSSLILVALMNCCKVVHGISQIIESYLNQIPLADLED